MRVPITSRAFKVVSANEDYEFRKDDKFLIAGNGDLVLSHDEVGGWIPNRKIKDLHTDTEVTVDYDEYYAKIQTLKALIAGVEEQRDRMRELFGGATYKLHVAVSMIEAADKDKEENKQ